MNTRNSYGGPTRTRVVALLAALCMMVCTVVVTQPAWAANSKTLSYSAALKVGKQGTNSRACLGYDYAYVDTMISGTVHSWTEYDSNGGKSESGFYGKGMQGSYTYMTKGDTQSTLRALYDAINSNHPAILWVNQSGNYGQHWVTIVGYTNVSDPNSLSMSNFLMLDPVHGAASEAESLASGARNGCARPYSLRLGSNNVRVAKGTVGSGPENHWGSDVTDVTGEKVKIRLAVNHNLVVDGTDGARKSNVKLWSDAGDVGQQIWTFQPQGDGSYKIVSSRTGMVMDIQNGDTHNGANVWQWDSNSAEEEFWFVERLSDGTYAFRNKKSGLYMNLASASGVGDGTNVTLWEKSSQADQTFIIDPYSNEIKATGISITHQDEIIYIQEDESIKLNATVSPDNATNKTVTWTAEDDTVASVSADGTVTGHHYGATIITAMTASGVSASLSVVVSDSVPTEATISPSDFTMTTGETRQLNLTILPADVKDKYKSTTWSSDDNSVATVDSSGVVTAHEAGTATISATVWNNGTVAKAKVTVKAPEPKPEPTSPTPTPVVVEPGPTTEPEPTQTPEPEPEPTITPEPTQTPEPEPEPTEEPDAEVTDVTVSPQLITVNVGETTQLTATVKPAQASDTTLSWRSIDPSVATVSADGVVTGVKSGATTITATSKNGISGFATLIVNAPEPEPTVVPTVPVVKPTVIVEPTGDPTDEPTSEPEPKDNDISVIVTPATSSVPVGGTITLTATVSPASAGSTIFWESADPTLATVRDGVVTGKKAGTATIIVMLIGSDALGTAIVTVTEPTSEPTTNPTTEPEPEPTVVPTVPVIKPTVIVEPTDDPTSDPTDEPTSEPEPEPKDNDISVIVTPATSSVPVGGTITLTASVSPASATSTILWESTNPTLATVRDGVVTGKKAGTVTIMVLLLGSDALGTAIVTVTEPTSEPTTNPTTEPTKEPTVDPTAVPEPTTEPTVTPVQTENVYRVYNPHSGEHHYTKDVNERAVLIIDYGWNDEGLCWRSPVTGTPVYRVYNPHSGEHHYTKDVNERAYLIGIGWNDEGVAWYTADTGTPVYRVYNPHSGEHHYTKDVNERAYLIGIGWNDEGVAWYSVDENS